MVALDLDHAVFEGAARAAMPFEFGGEILQRFGLDRNAPDRRDDLSTTALGRSTHANDAVACLQGRRFFARFDTRPCALASTFAASFGATTGWADATLFARIDESIAGYATDHG